MAGILLFVLSVSLFPELRRAEGNLEIPDSCKDIGVCEDIPNYPEDLAAGLIEDLEKNTINVFNKDRSVVPTPSRRLEPDDTDLCQSTQKIYAPRAARDYNGTWFFILNNKERPQQTFKLEICRVHDSPCLAAAYIQNGYEGRCAQKYIIRQMIGLDRQNQVVKVNIQLPSCCSCVLRRMYGLK
ncbi:protein spaetzle-like isoform X2 [Vanessa cardui]|uniref:protein spaetzle-like isoform X2 n=1 Tax=Vanessa cardui TaxID=171605 RepID=UPI001F1352EC|nr:protein spaetzle-like isoform X2 [Vanessa cardui]